ncbi:hypothetical protein BG011_003599, partial [Mortierella polycephala]
MSAVKYLYKYVYKGHDRTRMAVNAANLEQVVQQNLASKLTAWFTLNEQEPFAKDFTYIEVPKHFAWK